MRNLYSLLKTLLPFFKFSAGCLLAWTTLCMIEMNEAQAQDIVRDEVTFNAATNNPLDLSAQDESPEGIAFSSDGLSMFVVGNTDAEVNQYALTTAFDITTATFNTAFDVSTQDTSPVGITFSSDGMRMFIMGSTNASVYQYNLTTAFDISTATFDKYLDVSGQESEPNEIVFSTDGMRMFFTGTNGDNAYQYNLTTAFDISTSTFSTSLDISGADNNPRAFAFSIDGLRMFVAGQFRRLNQYRLSTAFDLTTATFENQRFIGQEVRLPSGLTFSGNGRRMFIVDLTDKEANQYEVIPPFDLTGATIDSNTQITVSFRENVQTNGGNPADFTVTDGVGNTFAVSAQADGTAGDTDIVLTVADFSTAIGDLTVAYTNNNNEISDATVVNSFAITSSTTADFDTTPPMLASAVRTNFTVVTVTFSEPILTNGTNPTDFTIVDANSAAFAVGEQSDGIFKDDQVVLTVADLSSAVAPLTLTYTNNNNEISDLGSNSLATDATGVTIAFVPIFESAPTAVVTEGTAIATSILDVNAIDGLGGSTDANISYSLSGGDAASFSIDANTGVISTASLLFWSNPIDANADNIYEFEVLADNNGSAATQTVQVYIIPDSPLDNKAEITQLGGDLEGNAQTNRTTQTMSLSADGSTVAIARSPQTGSSQIVEVYSYDGTAWTRLGENIEDRTFAFSRTFATSIDLSADGRTIAVGAPENESSSSAHGAVKIYHYSGGAWIQLGQDIEGEAVINGFGYDVRLSNNGKIVAIRGLENRYDRFKAGEIRVFQFNGNEWVRMGQDIDGLEGGSMSLSADGLIIGIGVPGFLVSNARVYRFINGAWTQLGTDIPGEANVVDEFGASVSLSANGLIMAVGAPEAGRVSVFSFDGTVWTPLGTDIEGEGVVSRRFGGNVKLSADGTVLAVSDSENGLNGLSTGQTQVFGFDGTDWVQLGENINGDQDYDRLGAVISLSADGTALAVRDNNTFIDNHRVVRVFQLVPLLALEAATKDSDTQITAIFDDNVQTAGTNPTDFTVLDGIGTAFAVSAQADGTPGDQNIILTVADLSSAVGDLTVSYTNNNGEIRDVATGLKLAVNSDAEIDVDMLAPNMVSAVRDNFTQISVTFSEPVQTNGANPTDFTLVDANSTAFAVNAQFDGEEKDNLIVLTVDDLNSAVGALTLTYTNNNDEISDFGSNHLVTDATGIMVEEVPIFESMDFAVAMEGADNTSVVLDVNANDGKGGGTDAGITYSLGGADAALFSIAADTGGIVFNAPPTWTNPADANADNFYEITVSANDGTANANQSIKVYVFPQTSFSDEVRSFQVGADIDGERANDNSGGAVSISADGQTIAIGARENDDNGFNSGQVRIYHFNGNQWSQVGEDIDGLTNYRSGTALSLSANGSTVAIGAPNNGSGITRVYRYDGTAWVQAGEDILGEASGDKSGSAVSLSADGQVLAIGAPTNDGNSRDTGHTRVYAFNGSFWTQLGADIDGEALADNSGSSINLSADGTILAIGAFENDANGPGSGHVRVYQYNGTTWQQLGGDIDGDTSQGLAGTAVSLSADGHTLALGATGTTSNDIGSGYVKIYQYDGTTWVQIGGDIDGEASGDKLGSAISLSADGKVVAIGAPTNDGNGFNAGHTRVYRYNGSDWVQLLMDIDGEAQYDESGTAVSLSADGSYLAIGAVSNDGSINNSGHVRVYELKNVLVPTAANKDSDTQITVSFDKPVQTTGANPEDFIILDGIGTEFTVSAQADGTPADNDIVLTVADLSTAVGDLTVNYTNNNDAISDADTGTEFAITGAVTLDTDTDSPTMVSAIRDSYSQITITYSEPVQTNGTNPTDFTVTDANSATYEVGLQSDGTAKDNEIVLTVADMSTVVFPITLTYTNNNNEISDFGGNTQITDATGVQVTRVPVFESAGSAVVFGGNPTSTNVLDVEANMGLAGNADNNITYSLAGTDAADFNIDTNTGIITFAMVPDYAAPADDNADNFYEFTVTATDGTVSAEQFIKVLVYPEGGPSAPASITQLGSDIDGEFGGDNFGNAVSVSADGKTVAIGATANDGNGNASGHVRIFVQNGSDWTQLGSDIDGEASNDNSGFPVRLSADGRTVAIGAQSNSGNGTRSGHVRVFSFVGTDWVQVGDDIDGESAQDNSGRSLGLSADGTVLAIGASLNQGNGSRAGHVRVYTLLENSWMQLGSDIDGENAGDESGIALDLSADGNTVAIGAYANSDNGPNAGHVRVFSYDASINEWTQLGANIDGEGPGDNSGGSVSLNADGKVLAIGAPGNSGNGARAGHARVYAFDGTNWIQRGTDIDGVAALDNAGSGLSLNANGTVLALGSNGNDNNGTDAGHTRVFWYTGTDWVQLGLDIEGEAANDRFGNAVSISADGRIVAIGASQNDGNGNNSGHVRIYQIETLFALVSATKDSETQITASFNEDVQTTGTNPADFTVTDGIGTNFPVSAQADGAAGDTDIVLTVADLSTAVGDLTVTYTNNNNVISNVLSATRFAVTSTTEIDVDVTPPTMVSASRASHTEVTITFNEPVQTKGTNPTDFSLADANGTPFAVIAQFDGDLKDNQITLTVEDLSTAVLPVSLTYTNNNDEVSDFGGNLLDTDATGVSVTFGPLFESLNATVVEEGTATGTTILDVDANDGMGGSADANITYSLSGMDAAHFSIDPANGALNFTIIPDWNAPADANSDNVYELRVSADNNGTVAIQSVRIFVFPTNRLTGNVGVTQLGPSIVGEVNRQNFAAVIALSGDGKTVAVGAPSNSQNGINSGKVYVYTYNGTEWIQLGSDIIGEATRDQGTRESFWSNNISLSANGRTMAIGAISNDGNGNDSGHVRVFTFDGTDWVQVGADIDGEQSGDLSGWSVSLSADGSIVAIGAVSNGGNGVGSGHVRVFGFNGNTWAQRGMDIDGEDAGDGSGHSISLSADGNVVAIGARTNDGNGDLAGHVRIFSYDGRDWTQRGGDIDGETAGDFSGQSVSLNANGTVVAIGSTNNDDAGADAGHVRIFGYNGSTWEQLGNDIDGEAEGDELGRSVSLSADGKVVAVGASLNDGNGDFSGHIRVFAFDGSGWVQQGGDIDGDVARQRTGFAIGLSADGSTLADGAIAFTQNNLSLGKVRLLNISNDVLLVSGTKDSDTQITASFNQNVQTTGTNPTDFSIADALGNAFVVSAQTDGTGGDTDIVLTVADLSTAIGDLTLNYTNNNDAISDAATGTVFAKNGGVAMDTDTEAPTLVSGTRDSNTQVTLTFSEPVQTNGTNPADFWVLDANSFFYAVSAQADGTANDTDIVLTIADFAAAQGPLTITYNNNNNEISDFGGNIAATDATGILVQLDITPPSGYTVSFNDALISGTEATTSTFTFTGAEVGATYDYTVSSSGGGSDVTGSGTIATATDEITLADLSGLNDGTLTISVTLTDPSNNEGTAETATTAFDGTAPSVTTTDVSTNDQTPGLSGTINDNAATISITIDGQTIAATNNGDGTWTLADNALASLAEGSYTASTTATDVAGNVSTPGTATVVIDLTGPVTTTDALTTNDQSPALSGTIDDNTATISVEIDGQTLAATNNGDGTWTLANNTLTNLAEGTYTANATATDAIGNVGTAGSATVVIDLTAPVTTVTALVTNDQTPALSGTVNDNAATVSVTLDGQNLAATNNGNGTWTLADNTLASLAEGSYTASVVATDVAGNASAAGTAAIEIDLTGPVVTNVSATTADGTYTVGSMVDVTVTFDEPVEVTGTPQLSLETGTVDQVVDYASGTGTNTLTFTYTVVTGDVSGDLDYTGTSALTLNGGTIHDVATNPANLSLAAPGTAGSLGANKALVIDGEPTVTLSVGSPTVTEAMGATTITATLSAITTTDVTVNLGYAGTATDGVDYDTPSGSITINAGQMSADATVGITAKQDAAAEGNETIIVSITAVTNGSESGTQEQTVTIVDDDAAVVTSVSATTADGYYKAGEVVSITVTFNLAVDVTGLPQLQLETGTTDQTVDMVSGNGTNTLTFDYTIQAGDESADLDYTSVSALMLNGGSIQNNAVDAILTLPSPGAANSLGASKAIVIDTQAPTLNISTVATDDIINALEDDSDIAISGTTDAEDGQTVTVMLNGQTYSGTVSSNSWSVTLPAADAQGLADGTFTITADVGDRAGNAATQASSSIDKDATLPTVTLTSSSSTITNDVPIPVTITFSEGITGLALTDFTTTNGTVSNLAGSGNTYTLDFTPTTDGAITVTLPAGEVADGAGNNNTISNTLSRTSDTAAPSAPVLTGITNDTGSSSSDGTTSDNTLVFSGTAEANSTVEVFIDAGSIGTATADGAGNWSYDHSATSLADAAYTVTATATDVAGNSSVASTSFSLTVDATAPAAPVLTNISADSGNSNTDAITTDNTLEFTGTAEANSTVEVFIDATSIGTVSADGSGNWTYDHSGTSLADASYAITAKATDAAGNVSAESTVLTTVVDNIAPEITSIDRVSPIASTINVSTVTFKVLFNEAVVNVGASEFEIVPGLGISGAVSGINQISASEYELVVSSIAGDGLLRVRSKSLTNIEDLAGSGLSNQVQSEEAFSYDITTPATVISSTETSPTAANPIPVSICFDRPVSGFDASDIVVTNATTGTLTATVAYTYDWTLGSLGTAQGQFDTPRGVAVDASGHVYIVDRNNNRLQKFDESGTFIAEVGTAGTGAGAFDNPFGVAVGPLGNVYVLDTNNDRIQVFDPNLNYLFEFGQSGNSGANGEFSFPFELAVDGQGRVFVGDFTRKDIQVFDSNGNFLFVFDNQANGGFNLIGGMSFDAQGNVYVSDFGLDKVMVFDASGNYQSEFGGSGTGPGQFGNNLDIAVAGDFVFVSDVQLSRIQYFDLSGTYLGELDAVAAGGSALSGPVSMAVSDKYELYIADQNNHHVQKFDLMACYSTSLTPTVGGLITVNVAQGVAQDEFGNDNQAASQFSILANSEPSDILLSSTSILENNAIGDAVGTLTTTDADGSDTHTYALVAGVGDTDNASFTISGDQLLAAEEFDRETKASYDIRLQTTDNNGGSFEKAFTITIDNVPEALMRIEGDEDIPGPTPLGISQTFDITIHNDGDATLIVNNIVYPIPFGGPVTGISVAPMSSQVVTMTFTPQAAQTYTGDITILSNGGTGILTVSADGAVVTDIDNGNIDPSAVEVYPNPADQLLTIDLEAFNGRPVDISLFDMNGSMAYQSKDNQQGTITIQVGNYQQGLYLLWLTDGDQLVQKKVMIKR